MQARETSSAVLTTYQTQPLQPEDALVIDTKTGERMAVPSSEAVDTTCRGVPVALASERIDTTCISNDSQEPHR